MNIAIYIYGQAEVLDFSGPFEVFSTASRVCPDGKPFSVFLVGETGKEVTARAGYRVVPVYGLDDHSPIDVLVVPGIGHKTRPTPLIVLYEGLNSPNIDVETMLDTLKALLKQLLAGVGKTR